MAKTNNTIINRIRNILVNIGVIIATFLLITGLFEIVYRYYLIDFYSAEYNYLNSSTLNKECKKKILVFGDSFTASPNSYIKILNDSFNQTCLINSGIPGIGAQEINCFASKRINKVNPDLVIVQVYVGNDLLDIKKPMNWNSNSILRNTYWLLSEKLFILRLLNYKLGQAKSLLGKEVETDFLKSDIPFSENKMSKREKILIQADPNYYEKSINLNSEFQQRFETFKNELKQINETCKKRNIPLVLLIIPASCQISNFYKNNLIECGARFNENNTCNPEYPFQHQLEQEFKNQYYKVLNPLPYFQKSDSLGKRIYYENDLHLNDKGQLLLSEYLKLNLKDELSE